MKLNNGKNIISTDDVFIKDTSEIGNNLTDILKNHDQSINSLKSDIKWLYKYGGVGGSGAGSSASKLKILAVMYYIDDTGTELFTPIVGGESISIKEGTEFSVVVTITSIKSLNEYKYTLGNYSTIIKSTDTNGKINIKPSNNDSYTLIVNGETTVSFTFNVYVKYMDKSLTLYDKQGYVVTQQFYKESIPRLEFILTNYIPDYYTDWDIKSLSINNESIKDFIIEEDTSSNTHYKKVNINLETYFKDTTPFGIYEFIVEYTFNNKTYKEFASFVYKKRDEIFIYCYTKNDVTLYENELDNPNKTKKRTVTIYYKIFGVSGSSVDTSYDLTILVGENIKNIGYVTINLEKSYFIQNTVEEDTLLPIIFSTSNYSKTYYVYLLLPDPLKYFFLENGEWYNGVEWCNTDESDTNVLEFPEFDSEINGYPIKEEQTYQVKKVANLYKLSDATNLSNLSLIDFIKCLNGSKADSIAVDGLFSFDLHHEDTNYDKPIITINNDSSKLIIYKNKIVYFSDDTASAVTDDTFFIPEDSFLLVYFKYNYSISVESKNVSPAVIFMIDGVYETKPFIINNFGSIKIGTTITYHSGNWYFKHLGFATFNCMPTNPAIDKYPNRIQKYYYDFDPVIPINYYQTYVNSIDVKDIFQTWLTNNQINSEIYENLSIGENWINYYNTTEKFININPAVLTNLTNLPAYKIVPTGSEDKDNEQFNFFVKETMTSFRENDETPTTTASFSKWNGTEFVEIMPGYLYNIDYQGSSTLLYGAKNFEISTRIEKDANNNDIQRYFTPDKNKFLLETSFNLKADMVDSSHSNNVIIGNYVNDYMVSPFRKSENDNKTKSCLTGYPCLLFIENKGKNKDSGDTLFLGIYNINLNRSSLINLGYAKLPENITYTTSENFEEVQYWTKTVTSEIENYSNSIRVAEVLDNSPLYDYSLYDKVLLQRMLGDFFNSSGSSGFDTTYSNAFETIFKHVCSQIYYMFKFNGSSPIFPVFDSNILSTIPNENSNYYYFNGNILTAINVGEPLIQQSSITNDFLNYTSTEDTWETTGLKSLSRITNPEELYHIVCTEKGVPVTDNNGNLLYYKTSSTIVNLEDLENHTFDLKNILQYYMTCMIFGMVDSVLKNLTIKCPEFNESGSIWYLGFYDMDTAFGISNSGGKINFKAFSDFVTDTLIISDYVDPTVTGWFDSPSSYIFMLAKYQDLLLGGSNKIDPYNEWIKLRANIFFDANEFCKRYVDGYFGNIHPLIWNLNFMYKYLGVNASTNETDTELSRFNGTMRHRRKYWLDRRLNFLDPLFGIKYNRKIGNSETVIGGNANIGEISTSMFEKFTKGVTGYIKSVELKGEPNSIVILQVSVSQRYIYIFDLNGIINTLQIKISSNTDAGFYGTKTIKSISDCGPFLNNTIEANTITNLYITVINILSGIANTSTTINYRDTPAVKEIYIQKTQSGSQYTIDWYDLELKNNKELNILEVDNATINKLELKNINCKQCIIKNSEITNINFINCNIEELKLSGTIYNYTFNNVKIESSITIPSGTTVKIESTEIPNLSIIGSLKELNINNGTIGTSTIGTITFNNTSRLETLNCTISKCSSFLIGGSENNKLENSTINFNDCLEEINFRFNEFRKLTTLTVNSNLNTKINLLNSCFRNNISLSAINSSNNTWYLKGNYVFYACLLLDFIFKNSVKIETSDISYTFALNNNLTTQQVITWLNNHNSDYDNITNIEGLFSNCYYNVINNNNLTTSIYNFINNNGTILNVSKMFYRTCYTTLTCNMAKLISKKAQHSDFIGFSEFDYINLIEVNDAGISALKFFKNIQIESWCVLKGTLLEGRVSYNNTDVQPTMSNLFNEELKSITSLNLFIEDVNHTFDCSGGLPSTLTTLQNFLTGSESWYVKNFDLIFNNTTNLTNIGRIFTLRTWGNRELNGSTYTTYNRNKSFERKIDLYKLLFNEDGTNKINLEKLLNNSWWNFTVPKEITYTNFQKLLEYLKNNNIYNIPWLFSNCVVIDECDSNILKNLLCNFKNLTGTFFNFNANSNYIDLEDAFKSLEGEDCFKCTSLQSTFAGNKLYKLINKFSDKRECKSLSNAFRSCYWKYKDSYIIDDPETLTSNSINIKDLNRLTPNSSVYIENPEFIPDIIGTNPWEKIFLIIPDGFFDILDGPADACFMEPDENKENLYGFIPLLKDESWNGKNNLLTYNYIIYLLKNVTENTKNYIIFPDWYVEDTFTNLNKLKVIIPIPPANTEINVFLFDSIKEFDYSNGPLPTIGKLNNKGNAVNDANWINNSHLKSVYFDTDGNFISNLKCIYNSELEHLDTLPTGTGSQGLYKNKIPNKLAMILNINSNRLFYISNASVGTKDKYIIENLQDLYHSGNSGEITDWYEHLSYSPYSEYLDEIFDPNN